jgi:hypothetical protein
MGNCRSRRVPIEPPPNGKVEPDHAAYVPKSIKWQNYGKVAKYIKETANDNESELFQICLKYYHDDFIVNADKVIEDLVDYYKDGCQSIALEFDFDSNPKFEEFNKMAKQNLLDKVCKALYRDVKEIYGKEFEIGMFYVKKKKRFGLELYWVD